MGCDWAISYRQQAGVGEITLRSNHEVIYKSWLTRAQCENDGGFVKGKKIKLSLGGVAWIKLKKRKNFFVIMAILKKRSLD